MIEIGKINQLIVRKENKSGYYLGIEDEFGEVFLPPSLSDKPVAIGDEVSAFVYVDTKDQLVATTRIPFAQVGEFAYLKVVDVQDFGAFLDFGIDKDLLIPGNEQKIKLRSGEYVLVRICIEEGTDRIFATSKLGEFFDSEKVDLEMNTKVEMLVTDETDLGFRVIVEKKYIGIIYHSEIFKDIQEGDKITGFVKKVREDGLIDCATQIQGIKNLDQAKIKILKFLISKGGRSHLHDKSSPDEIYDLLAMSKKTFKNAIGMLYRDKKILISKTGIEVVKK